MAEHTWAGRKTGSPGGEPEVCLCWGRGLAFFMAYTLRYFLQKLIF